MAWFFYLPLVSMTNPPMNWAYSRSAEGFIHGITLGQFEPWRPTNQPVRVIEQLWTLGRITGSGFGWPYFVFAALPLGLLPRLDRCARNWLLGLMAAFLCSGPLLITILNPDTDLSGTDLLGPYFGAMDIVLALWTGLGFLIVANLLAKARPAPTSSLRAA